MNMTFHRTSVPGLEVIKATPFLESDCPARIYLLRFHPGKEAGTRV